MNVYDFDKTIFYPDSTFTFIKYCMRRYPKWFKPFLGDIAKSFAEYKKSGDAAAFKEALFGFLTYVPDIDSVVEDFWDNHIKNIGVWYLNQKKSDDVIISASPEFLLRPMADAFGFELIATKMDKYSGKIAGANCHDAEKVRRFREVYPHAEIEEFYSDSLSDAPMAELAAKAYMVKKGTVSPWP